MDLYVNGVKETSPSSLTIAQLVADKGLRPDGLVVELNREIIKQEQWAATVLRDGDRLELLNFVGGG
ncbi:MAG: sulfur carrier protein ThiS [Desulfobulbus sp.]|jgi:sulfur carrier protein